MGKTLARKIRKIGAASDTPNHRMATGIQAMGEIGRNAWISGLNACCARRNQPSISPKGTPTSTASTKPQVTRNSEATMYLKSSPFCDELDDARQTRRAAWGTARCRTSARPGPRAAGKPHRPPAARERSANVEPAAGRRSSPDAGRPVGGARRRTATVAASASSSRSLPRDTVRWRLRPSTNDGSA